MESEIPFIKPARSYSKSRKSSRSASSLGAKTTEWFRRVFSDEDNPTKERCKAVMNCLVFIAALTVGIVMAVNHTSSVDEVKYGEFFRWFAIVFIPGVSFSNLLFGSKERMDRWLGIPQAALAIVFVVFYYRFTNPADYDNQNEYLNMLIIASVWVMTTAITCSNPMTFKMSNFWLSLGSSACIMGLLGLLVSGGIGAKFDRT